jgi:hypothetical protein
MLQSFWPSARTRSPVSSVDTREALQALQVRAHVLERLDRRGIHEVGGRSAGAAGAAVGGGGGVCAIAVVDASASESTPSATALPIMVKLPVENSADRRWRTSVGFR